MVKVLAMDEVRPAHYVLFTDHLAAMEEKDADIERLDALSLERAQIIAEQAQEIEQLNKLIDSAQDIARSRGEQIAILRQNWEVVAALKAEIAEKDRLYRGAIVVNNDICRKFDKRRLEQDNEIAALEKTATEQDDCILHFQARVAELKAKVDRRQMALKAIVMGYGVVNVLDIAQEAMKNEEGA